MGKINIAELLKDCPKGIELYSPLCGECKLYDVNDYNIRIEASNKDTLICLYHDGRYCANGEIMLFPKGKTTWEGFQSPFKDGDVVVTEDDESFQLFLLKHLTHSEDDNGYDGYCYFGWDFQCNELFEKGNWGFNRLATEEEKEKLFQAIKDNGYKWNSETKTLEKLVEKDGIELTKVKDYQNVIIECDIYRSDVMVHFGNLDGIKEVLSSFMTKDEIKEIYDSLYETKRGKTIILYKGQVIVYMPNIPTTPFDFATLQHELLHAVWFITDRVGITPSADSEEVYNYLLDFLTERVINAFSLTIRPT